jgi:uncharacterized membrane protein YkvA (DUF1232 family)
MSDQVQIDQTDDLEQRAMEAFDKWLKSLNADARTLIAVVGDEQTAGEVRRPLAGALNYLFKSLDLIDDGIEGLGYMDDAFVIRIAAATAKNSGPLPETLNALADDVALIDEFLGDIAPRLRSFVASLGQSVVRGRSVDAVLTDGAVREEFLGDVSGWAGRYRAPAFVVDDKGLAKLRSFLNAKLG